MSSSKTFLLFFVLIGAVVFIRSLYVLDPDFGWHFRLGGIILQTGIPKTDPLSYTMPSYAFIDHEWLSNVIINILYRFSGMYILALIYTLLFIFSLLFTIPKNLKNYSLVSLVLGGSLMVGFTGVRTQIITWFFLAILLKIILDKKLWNKWKFFIPLLFLPWANLHGGFSIGIGTLLVAAFIKTIQDRKVQVKYWLIFILSLLVTFLNPYGPRIWYEIWMQATDTALRWRISEWLPGAFYLDPSFIILLAFSFTFLVRYRNKFNLLEIGIFLSLFALSFSSLRNIPLWTLVAIPITSKGIYLFIEEVKKKKVNQKKFLQAKEFIAILLIALFICEIGKSFFTSYYLTESREYPINAVAYINKQKITARMFSIYDWGGYLDWKIPSQKVFIDGRMPSWRRSGNYPIESDNAMNEYIADISNINSLSKAVKKYNISYLLLPVAPPAKEDLISKIGKILNASSLVNAPANSITDISLKKIGMVKIYEDGQAVIYKLSD